MRLRRIRAYAGPLLAGGLCALAAGPSSAGGSLDVLDLGAAVPAHELPGVQSVPLAPQRVDSRCLPVPYLMNIDEDPVPVPLPQEPFLAVQEAAEAIQQSMDAWNAIPTAFSEARIAGVSEQEAPAGFDFRNEQRLDRPEPGFFTPLDFARSISWTLTRRTVFGPGDDLDRDGDPDVSAALSHCADADGDGDLEFAAGTYEAGTILDNDVVYNTAEIRFTTQDEQIDTDPLSVDLRAIATHELGHSLGLSHSLINQRGPDEGNGALMFPLTDAADPDAERAQRTPDPEAVAIVSEKYPEGTAAEGPAALGRGDVAFRAAFGQIRGRVLDPDGKPVLSASVFCRERGSQLIANSSFAGAARVGRNPAGELVALSPAEAAGNGEYRISLPPGVYECGIEALDEKPIESVRFEQLALAPGVAGRAAFPEEFFDGPGETALEPTPGAAVPLTVVAGETLAGIDFVTNVEFRLATADLTLPAVDGDVLGPGQTVAALIPGERLLELEQRAKTQLGAQASLAIHTAAFLTDVVNASTVPRFQTAGIHACERSPGLDPLTGLGLLTLDPRPLSAQPFVGQPADLGPLYLEDPVRLGSEVLAALRAGTLKNVCLVVRAQQREDFPGALGLPPGARFNTSTVPLGLSFFDLGDGVFRQIPFDLQFALSAVPVVPGTPTPPPHAPTAP